MRAVARDLKVINDSLGHESGDRLLQSMATFLRQFFRAGDRIFRVGGDEFSVLLPSTNVAEAEAIGARLGFASKRSTRRAGYRCIAPPGRPSSSARRCGRRALP